jgi:ethanolamine utilization protein EutA
LTFTAPGRAMAEEDEVVLTSVGVDIGSSTSHLLFSRLVLERQDARYVTVARDVLFESAILLTPYLDEATIDQSALAAFISTQYRAAGIARAEVDTGALILTGVALLRHNARAIADVFAAEAGKFVAVSAGDNLEATMAAHGSGAVRLSETCGAVMNVDIGGGTTKVVICHAGEVAELAALDVGARLIAFDAAGHITRLEPAAGAIASRLGLGLKLGDTLPAQHQRALATHMVDQLVLTLRGGQSHLLRTPPLQCPHAIRAITFSGGVSEFIYGRAREAFGDLGPVLAEELQARAAELGAPIVEAHGGIRATVIGASQYTIQLSGSTIYLSPLDVVPLRNVPVVRPTLPPDGSALEVASAIQRALRRFDLLAAHSPVAIAIRWHGSATYKRLTAVATGTVDALQRHLDAGHPLILVFDNDIGGLLGLHLREELRLPYPIISIDNIDLQEFDYIDIGAQLPSSGAVPVVIKSLVFPP